MTFGKCFLCKKNYATIYTKYYKYSICYDFGVTHLSECIKICNECNEGNKIEDYKLKLIRKCENTEYSEYQKDDYEAAWNDIQGIEDNYNKLISRMKTLLQLI